MSNTSDFGYGQLQPQDSGTDLNATSYIVRQMMATLSVMKLVKVTAVHPGSGTPPVAGTVDVQLLVNQVDGNGNPVKHGTVYGLPYFRLGSTWQVVIDPVVGEYGYIVCADRDSSLVISNKGGQQNPGSFRQYDIADGIYMGGIGVLNGAPKASLYLKSDGTVILTDQNNNVLQSTNSGWNLGVGGTTVMSISSSGINITGTITSTGDITAGSISLENHIHPVSVPSTPFTGDTGLPIG